LHNLDTSVAWREIWPLNPQATERTGYGLQRDKQLTENTLFYGG